MKKTLTSIMALGILTIPTFSLAQTTPQVEALMKVSPEIQVFMERIDLFSDTPVGGEPISRADAAKLFVDYLLKTEGTSGFAQRADQLYGCTFTDVSTLPTDTQTSIKTACLHGLFKGNNAKFFPNDPIKWVEALAVLSRVDGNVIAEGNPRRKGYHTLALQKGRYLPTSDVSLEGNITKQDFTRLLYSFTTKKFPDFVSLLTGYAQPITTPQTPTAQTATTPTTTLTNTSRTLKEVDGKAVSGTYILTFSGTTLSTQLCNVIGGEYTIQNNTIHGNFVQTEMLCLDEERNALENIFTLSGATFTIASTRMVDNNIQRLTITTPDTHTFTYLLNSSQNPEQAIGGQKDEHGCYLGAGYSWNEAAQECQRPREQKNATALDNTQWKLEKFNGKPLTGSYALSFDQGKLTAKFCNTLQGNYTLSGDSITGTLISTLVACTDDEPNTLEKGFTIDPGKWATLNDTLTITTSGDNIYTRKFSLK